MHDAELYARARGAYLGLAVGDALGVSVEFMTPREIQHAYGELRDICGGGWLRLRSGLVSDDTTMSLALGRSMLAEGGVSAPAVAEAFSAWMRAKPVDIGDTVRRGISHYRISGETTVPFNPHCAGNGAAMRCLPVALGTLGDAPDQIERAAMIQAHVTHNSGLSDQGTLYTVRMVQAGLAGAGLAGLEDLAEELVAVERAFEFRGRRHIENPSGFIVETLQAVLQALTTRPGFEGAMIDVVNRGGDADTTGAILGMIAGALYGENAIPQRWINALDKDIARQCTEQAEALIDLRTRGPMAALRADDAPLDGQRFRRR